MMTLGRFAGQVPGQQMPAGARQWPTDELFSVLLPDGLRYLQVRVGAGVVILSLGERDTDGRRSHPELRKWTYTSRPSGDIEG
jgi:hypothetical protein